MTGTSSMPNLRAASTRAWPAMITPSAVHQDRIRPPELPDTGRHLGDLRLRMRAGVPGIRQERANRPKLDLRGEIHPIRGGDNPR